jgi:hypothetical protein
MDVEATVTPGVPGPICRAKVLVAPLAVPVRVAVWVVVTVETDAVNAAVVAPEATVTEAGTVTELLLLANVTVSPPDTAAEVRLTVQASLPEPVMELLVQETALRVPPAAFNCRAKVLVAPLAVPVKVAVCVVVTVETAAVNAAVVAPDATVTEAGTVTALLLLARVTVRPPDAAAAVRLTVQASLPEPVMELLVQETALRVPAGDWPVPLRLTTAVPLLEELLLRVSDPLAAPAVVGLKVTVRVTLWPGLRVTGKLAPDTVNPAPVTAPELIVRSPVPEEVIFTDCVVGVLRFTLPNDRLAVLRLRVGVPAFSCRVKAFATVPDVAVSVAA